MLKRQPGVVDYPTSDGRPMAETDRHREQMFELIHALQRHFATRPDVYVSGNLLLFYREGDKRRHVSPDVLVALGVPKHERDYYLLWQEPGPPTVVMEVTSKSTRREDMVKKRDLYLELGVQEYFLFDPTGDYLDPRLRGYRRSAGEWLPLHGRVLESEALGLQLRIVDDRLRLIDRSTGEMLPSDVEYAEQERQRAEQERQRAEQERQRAEQERQRANLEEQRRLAAEAEVARLRALLDGAP